MVRVQDHLALDFVAKGIEIQAPRPKRHKSAETEPKAPSLHRYARLISQTPSGSIIRRPFHQPHLAPPTALMYPIAMCCFPRPIHPYLSPPLLPSSTPLPSISAPEVRLPRTPRRRRPVMHISIIAIAGISIPCAARHGTIDVRVAAALAAAARVAVCRGPVLAAAPLAAAGEEDEDHADKQQNHGRERRPHPDAVVGVGAAAVAVDVVFDDLRGRACY